MTKEQKRADAIGHNSTVAAVLAALLAVIAGVVVLSRLTQDDDRTPATPAGAATGFSTATGSSTDPALAQGCTSPPPAPGTAAQLSAPDAAAIAAVTGKSVVATLQTTCGPIELTLDGAKAPRTVASFTQLAKAGYWQDAPCHRLVTSGIFVLQCGDPTGSGSGGPGYGYGIENAPADGRYPRGTVAMARTDDPDSNGGQYFIVFADTDLPTDGGGYSIFGVVSSGMDIVDRIAAGGVADRGPGPKFPISTLTVTTTTKG